MQFLYQEIFYRPIFNLLVFFYETASFHDLGIAIILTTVLIRLILYPFFHSGAKQQMLMQRIQPKVKKIQETHKGDMQKQSEELMALYKEHGVNPFSTFLLLIIQLPIMFAFYWVVRAGIGPSEFSSLYSFIHAPSNVGTMFLGFINLASPSWLVIILAAAAQFLQARLAIWRAPAGSQPSQAEKIQRQMMYITPFITLLVFYALPASVGLYWFVSSAFSAAQQYVVNRHLRAKYGN